MSTIRNNHLFPCHITTRTMIVINHHQSRQFAMCTSIRLKRELSQASQRTKSLVEHGDYRFSSHSRLCRLRRVQVLELWKCCYLFVNLRIVLHGTRPKRIEARIHTKVIVRQIRIVTHHRQLITLWQSCILGTFHRSRYLIITKIILGQ